MSKIVTVAPLIRGPWAESLTYFSSQKLNVGDLVKAPAGRRSLPAVVIESSPVELVRANIRSADIQFKKLGPALVPSFISEDIISAARKIAAWQIAPLGAVLKKLIPQAIITSYCLQPSAISKLPPTPENLSNIYSVAVVQDNLSERLSIYKNLIREAFAKKQSVLVCTPNTINLGILAKELSRGIENYTSTIESQKSKVALRKTWETCRQSKHPLLIITTMIGLAINRSDLGLIILEGDSEAGTTDIDRWSLSLRHTVEKIAETRKIRLVIGDEVLALQTIYQTEVGNFLPLFPPLKYRSVTAARQNINTTPDKIAHSSEPAIISEETLKDIAVALEANDRIAILTGRRGLSSITICQDCGTSVRCHRCHAPLVIHEEKERVFRCHRCQLSQSVPNRCPKCRGWRQITLGIGIDRVIKLLTQLFPTAKSFVLDSDHTPRRSLINKTIKEFLATPGSFIIGTEMLTHHLQTPIETTIGLALDSRLALPEYRASERLFRQLITLRSLATKSFIIDTRDPNHPIFEHARKGNILDFVRDELEIRRTLKFPPIYLLLKISAPGTEGKNIINWLEEKTIKFKSDKILSAGTHGHHFLIFKLKLAEWPIAELIAILKTLPPTVNITVNPENLI